jgi:hypothetical protein
MSNNPSNKPQQPPQIHLDTAPPPHNAYGSVQAQESSDQLLSPMTGGPGPGPHRYRDQSPNPFSPTQSTYSSRRSSWESQRSRDSRGFDNPFRDSSQSRPGSRADSEDDINTQTVSEKYNILPSAGLLLYPEDIEKDDYLHNPDPGGEPRDCNIWTRRGLVNVGGLFLMTLGILTLFIGYPAMYVFCHVDTLGPFTNWITEPLCKDL